MRPILTAVFTRDGLAVVDGVRERHGLEPACASTGMHLIGLLWPNLLFQVCASYAVAMS